MRFRRMTGAHNFPDTDMSTVHTHCLYLVLARPLIEEPVLTSDAVLAQKLMDQF